MGSAERSRFVNVCPTMWGMEVRVVLTQAEAKDLSFILGYAADEGTALQAVAAALGHALRVVAWSVADTVQVFPPGVIPTYESDQR